MQTNLAIRHRSRFLLIGLAGALLAALMPVQPASATNTSCSYDSDDKLASFSVVTPSTVTIYVAKGGAIKWRNTLTLEELECNGATVNNTNRISVADFNTAAEAEITIDFSRSFGPGATPETVGVSEIEWDFFGNKGENELRLVGSGRDERFAFGEEGVNYNKDSDVDMEITEFQTFVAWGAGGQDALTGAGGFGTGGPFGIGLTLYGGAAKDSIFGTNKKDTMSGSAGGDSMEGRGGPDIVFGDGGDDVLKGGKGGDEIDGLANDDVLRGQGGPDDLEGGGGTDDCDGGPGADTETTCET